MAAQPGRRGHGGSPRTVEAEHPDTEGARVEAERMMQLDHPVAYTTVRALLRSLQVADAEIAWLRTDRNRWQEAYCDARLEGRRRGG